MNTQALSDPKSWAERTDGEGPTARYASHETSSTSGHPAWRRTQGVLRHADMHSWKETKALYRLRRSSQMSPWLMRGFVIEQLYEDAKQECGPDDFQGRR